MTQTIVEGTTNRLVLTTATPADAHLEPFDNTKWTALNTCPTWGITRYQMGLREKGGGRRLALEAGQAMHEVFSLVRLASLADQVTTQRNDPVFTQRLWQFHGNRLFGQERFDHITAQMQNADDLPDACKRGAIAVLDTSGYYDDPRDTRRTLNNMEVASSVYVNRWRWDHPVWMRDPSDPTSDVGIEIPFEFHAHITGSGNDFVFRFVGRVDGIHYDTHNKLVVHDNKTAARLNDAWSLSQMASHQYTGYCVAASHFIQDVVQDCLVLGLALPQPKGYEFTGFAPESMKRASYHLRRWVDWIVHTMSIAKQYENNPFDAPKYTHSCNRYFSACSLVPFCYADDDQQKAYLSEMEVEHWSPLDKTILTGVGSE